MEILYVPAGGTGRYQVNDTHLHKPMKGYAQYLAVKWYTKNGSLDGFDPLKVDIISVHEQAARGVSQAESKYHEM